jgi:hypothetical protein
MKSVQSLPEIGMRGFDLDQNVDGDGCCRTRCLSCAVAPYVRFPLLGRCST